MDIAFVSTYNARNVINWSGLGYYISRSLEDNGNNLQYVGELPNSINVFNFLKKAFYSKILNKKFDLERTVARAKGYSENVANRLKGANFDCVFSPGTIPIAFLKTDRPKVSYTDATFACMLNYYEPASMWSPDMIRQGHEIEKQALESSALAIYSSDWAAESAIQFYGISPTKVKVVPFGANFNEEYSELEVKDFIAKRNDQTLKILFNGVNYIRKGGDLVVAAVQELQSRGLKVELHFAGLKELPFDKVPDFVVNHGFLKKAIPAERTILEDLYKTSHFLFLPSIAEAFGCVFCEASSFGMPSISRKTGGVPTAIHNGVNGFTLDNSASVHDYADLIYKYFTDKDKYTSLAMSSFHEYKKRLNWKVAGESITTLIKELG